MKQSTTIAFYFIVAILSVLLSVQAIVSNPVLSSDSILYLRVAEAFSAEGLSSALDLYSWPFLSVLIAQLHHVTGLSFETSGYALSIFFYAVINCAFISLIKELGGSARTQLFAAYVILTYPTLNDYRDYIIRDHGYWGLLLMSLIFLLRFQAHSGLRNAIGWMLCCVTAFVFRIEALALLLLVPLTLLIGDKAQLGSRFKKVLMLYLVTVVFSVILILVMIGIVDLQSTSSIVSMVEQIPASLNDAYQSLDNSIAVIRSALANPYLHEDVGFVFVSGMLMLLFFQGMHALLPNNLIMLIWGRGLILNPFTASASSVIFGHLFVIFLYLLFAIYSKQFINDRFMVPFCLVLMVWLPFYANAILEQFHQQRVRWAVILLGLLLSYSLFDSLISTGTKKQHISEAITWLNANSKKERKLLTNNAHIAYFSKQEFDSCAYNLNPARAYFKKDCPGRDLLVIEMKERDEELAKRLKSLQRYKGFRVINRFSNERGDQIVILQVGE